MIVDNVKFPEFAGVRCLMMPYIQGDPDSVPREYESYKEILKSVFFKKGDIGYLTIDESLAKQGKPHRGSRATTSRAIHTEAGKHPDKVYAWGGGGWGSSHRVELDPNTKILLANNLDDSCVVWDSVHEDTSIDGDIGHMASLYPYDNGMFMKAGEVYEIGILTPHESLPVKTNCKRQFLRIVSSGVYGKESYFTENPLIN